MVDDLRLRVNPLARVLVPAKTGLGHGLVVVVELREDGLLVRRRQKLGALPEHREVGVIRGNRAAHLRLAPGESPFHSPPPFVVAVLEHFSAIGGHAPKIPLFVTTAAISRQLLKAFVEGEIMADAVLPALPVLFIVGEFLYYETVDAGQRELVARGLVQRH